MDFKVFGLSSRQEIQLKLKISEEMNVKSHALNIN